MGTSDARRLALARPDVVTERPGDGTLRLRSSQPLGRHADTVSQWLHGWAAETPDRVFLAERSSDGGWRDLTYGNALATVLRLAQGLLDADLSADRPLMVLSENSLEHGMLALAAMHIGVPVVPVSVAYSLLDPSLAKLRHIARLVRPGLVFASDRKRYAAALAATGAAVAEFHSLQHGAPSERVAQAHAVTGPDSVAKILFTSGSTGTPKGVVNTQRMLTANQQQSIQVWQFVREEPPVVVDWLPWNHTFGGNYNFNLVLSNGGTMYLDGGKPIQGLFDTSLRNLREIAPTMYFNVPRGFDLLLPTLQSDAAFRRHFFFRCRFGFYAAAALPQAQWEAFMRLAREERGDDFVLVSAWGSTETAPLCTAVHFPIARAGIVGLPVPGCEVKLVPNAGKYEARVRGPNVTPGYYRDPDQTAAAFDEEGFYRIGDALRLDDPSAPERGLVFDGRVAEDFKLSSGTWVSAGKLRIDLVSAADGLVQDAVITGHDRSEVGALLFLNASKVDKLEAASLRDAIRSALQAHNGQGDSGSSCRIARALVLVEPPSIEHGEITDKGYINQRFVLERRQADVDRLYSGDDHSVVIA
jgi:feruloyl-CoA synthase